jgi:hypothetical protein
MVQSDRQEHSSWHCLLLRAISRLYPLAKRRVPLPAKPMRMRPISTRVAPYGFGETRDATLALLTLTVLSGSRFQRRRRANRIRRLHLYFAVYTFIRTKPCGFQPKTMRAILAISPTTHADMIGAAAGAGTGLVVAGPVGAVAGGLIGGFFGRPFWGPPMARAGRIITSAAIVIGELASARDRIQHPPITSVVS